ncbi:MAG: hypothetical protein J3K34DRAFT_439066 [Monoraphidium minutum]|nr:MAG: hypothetical protein J3K34DRAFT_439066 [Monoraphidium minutum]
MSARSVCCDISEASSSLSGSEAPAARAASLIRCSTAACASGEIPEPMRAVTSTIAATAAACAGAAAGAAGSMAAGGAAAVASAECAAPAGWWPRGVPPALPEPHPESRSSKAVCLVIIGTALLPLLFPPLLQQPMRQAVVGSHQHRGAQGHGDAAANSGGGNQARLRPRRRRARGGHGGCHSRVRHGPGAARLNDRRRQQRAAAELRAAAHCRHCRRQGIPLRRSRRHSCLHARGWRLRAGGRRRATAAAACAAAERRGARGASQEAVAVLH